MTLSRADFLSLYQQQKRKYGVIRGLIRSFRKDLQRLESRRLLAKYIRKGATGLEIGAGEQTIAPPGTKLADAYPSHAGAPTMATEFFPAEEIPYPDQSFDFILTEHVLEHVPDVIRCVREWKRVTKKDGKLFLFMPHPERTFDKNRPVTPLDHFQKDFDRRVRSSDDEHWCEWQTHVIAPGLAPHYQAYSKDESLENNLIHRHVFTPKTLAALLSLEGWDVVEVIDTVVDRGDSFVIVAKRV